MESSDEPKQENHRSSTKSRVIGKLFSSVKGKKGTSSDDVDSFLHGSSDKLLMTGTAPPLLKISTEKASRWPTATEINQKSSRSRKRSDSARSVRFTTQPEVIGEGGDEAEAPSITISQARKRSHTLQPSSQTIHPPLPERAATIGVEKSKTPTGTVSQIDFRGGKDGAAISASPDAGVTEVFVIKSESARLAARMNAAEGRSLVQATSTASLDSGPLAPSSSNINAANSTDSAFSSLSQPHLSQLNNPSVLLPDFRDGTQYLGGHSAPLMSAQTSRTHEFSSASVLQDYSNRVRNLYKLFELSAESVAPIESVSVEDYARIASWWFLRGRMNLEQAAKRAPMNFEGSRSNELLIQQSHADLAKSIWLVQEVMPHRAKNEFQQSDGGSNVIPVEAKAENSRITDVSETCQTIYTNLEKLCLSMNRNNLLPPPPEEAILPQGLDTSIWITYPSQPTNFSQYHLGSASSLLRNPSIEVSKAFPIGDTATIFFYTRMWVNLYLIETRNQSRQLGYPCLVSICRTQSEKDLTMMVASQSNFITICVQSDETKGPTWKDITWLPLEMRLELKVSNNLVANIQFSEGDFKNFCNLYEYTVRIHASLSPGQDENLVYTKSCVVQYFDRDPQRRIFPKEPVPNCDVRIMEKVSRDIEPNGARNRHRGYRIAVVTHVKTKQLNGFSHDIHPWKPLQYGFLRSDSGAPALFLKFEEAVQRATVYFNFDSFPDRTSFHDCLIGRNRASEAEVAHFPIKQIRMVLVAPGFIPFTPTNEDTDTKELVNLDWSYLRVINRTSSTDFDPELCDVVHSTSLRILVESRLGIVTDRLNVAPGELKIRLSAELSDCEITVFREAQNDMTIAISETQQDICASLAGFLSNVAKTRSLSRYRFTTLEDLHTFQAAISGYKVLYDGIAETFAVSRRRIVVSTHKKLEASQVRLQVLRRQKITQVVVFFDQFIHGDCMNFTIQATDMFEAVNSKSKFNVRIVDAKFAAPRIANESDGRGKEFVCLDTPDHPVERDDIVVSFDTVADRDSFGRALPSPLKAASRLGSVLR